MDLYLFPPSPYSQKTLIAVNEKGLTLTLQAIRLFDKGEVAAYREVYPLGKLPCLKHNDLMLSESTSIVEYLDDLEFGKALVNLPPAREIRYWDRLLDCNLLAPSLVLLFQSFKAAPESKAIDRAKGQIDSVYAMLEARLESRDLLAGEVFSLADITLMAGLSVTSIIKPFTDFKRLTSYFEEYSKRQSYVDAREYGQPFIEPFLGYLQTGS